MIMRFVVPATAAALMFAASAFAAQNSTTAQSPGMQECAQLEAQINSELPGAIPSEVRKVTAERDDGAKLCNSGKTDEGIAKLEQAVSDVAYRG